MKISHRLVALSVLSGAGLACVAGVSYFAVTSIQRDLQGLTTQASPLQARTLELQERSERIMGTLLRLSHARTGEELQKITQDADTELQRIERLRREISALGGRGGSATGGGKEFAAAHEQIAGAARRRLADDAAYRSETEAARKALAQAEQQIGTARQAVQGIAVEAGQAADKAQEAVGRLAMQAKLALMAQNRLKDVVLVVNDADATTNRFRLTPLREKVKAPLDSIQRLEAGAGGVAGGNDPLAEVRAAAMRLWEMFARDGTGLLSLRAKVLTKAEGSAAAYAAQRHAVIALVDEQLVRLGALADGLEVQGVKQRQALEAALKLRNEPGGVVATSEAVALGIRDMGAGLRQLMLVSDVKELQDTQEAVQRQGVALSEQMKAMRAGLVKMGRSQLAEQVQAAHASMDSVTASIDKLAASRKGLLESEAAMARSLVQLKEVAASQAELGERQVRFVGERQAEVSAAVDDRVRWSLAVIIGISLVAVAVIGALSWSTVRTVTRRLHLAVAVAEQVSHGNLYAIPEASTEGRDETARLLAALSSMVGMLKRSVADIQGAAHEVDVGAGEISSGNQDLSQRTESQATALQQTAESMQLLGETVRANAEHAQQASALAAGASGVAERGGHVVGAVVQKMRSISDGSTKMAEIIATIDAIAFRTNLLALNAAVEAARAGEQGRGFAVVASEVRALAGRSAEAAQEIKSLIDESVGQVQEGARLVDEAGATMQEIVSATRRVTDIMREISDASAEQSAGVARVGQAMHHMDEGTQRNAALVEQSAAAATNLKQLAQQLTHAVAMFRLRRAADTSMAGV